MEEPKATRWHRALKHRRSLSFPYPEGGQKYFFILKGADFFNAYSLLLPPSQVDWIIRMEGIVGGCDQKSASVEYCAASLIQEASLILHGRFTYAPIPLDVVEVTELRDESIHLTIEEFLGQHYPFRNHPRTVALLKSYLREHKGNSHSFEEVVASTSRFGRLMREVLLGPFEYRYLIQFTEFRIEDWKELLYAAHVRKGIHVKNPRKSSHAEAYLDGLTRGEIFDFLYRKLGRIYSLPSQGWKGVMVSFSDRMGEVAGIAHGLGLYCNDTVARRLRFRVGSFAPNNTTLAGAVMDWHDTQFYPSPKLEKEGQAHDLLCASDSIATLGSLLGGMEQGGCFEEETLKKIGLENFRIAYNRNYNLARALRNSSVLKDFVAWVRDVEILDFWTNEARRTYLQEK